MDDNAREWMSAIMKIATVEIVVAFFPFIVALAGAMWQWTWYFCTSCVESFRPPGY
jgi:DNA-binding transcriptional regulator of glucitol operon